MSKTDDQVKASEKLMQEAEVHAQQQIAAVKKKETMRKKQVVKFGSLMVLTVIILIFATMHMQIKQMTAETA